MTVANSNTAAAQTNTRIIAAPASGNVLAVYGIGASAAGAETVVFYDGEAADVKEVLTIDRGTSTGGTWILTVNGNDSGPIQWNAADSAVDTAVQGITGVTATTVTGAGTVGDPWIITFDNPTGALTTSGTGSLTGGDATLTVTETTAGVDQGNVVYRLDFLAGGPGSVYHGQDGKPLFTCSNGEKLSFVSTASAALFLNVQYKTQLPGLDIG